MLEWWRTEHQEVIVAEFYDIQVDGDSILQALFHLMTLPHDISSGEPTLLSVYPHRLSLCLPMISQSLSSSNLLFP